MWTECSESQEAETELEVHPKALGEGRVSAGENKQQGLEG